MSTTTPTAERQRLSDLAAPAEAAPVATRRPDVLPAEPPDTSTAIGPRLVASTQAIPHVSGRSPQMGQLAAAMASAQGEIVLAITNQEGKSKGKTSGVEFTFPYADLGAVIDVCSGPLSKHKIARFQPAKTIGNRVSVTTLLVHESGEWIAETIELPIEQGVLTHAQAAGAAMTYARRYGLSALLGIGVADGEDLDAGQHLESPVRPGKGPVQMPQRDTASSAARTAEPSTHAGTPEPPPAPGPQTSAGFTVVAIEKRPRTNGKPGFFWPVKFSNGVIASTFNASMGEALERAHKNGTKFADVLTTKAGNFIYIDELVPMPTGPSW